jgi:7,8-dihydro-6-hydroxymethylpterin-pyrophosphokinase
MSELFHNALVHISMDLVGGTSVAQALLTDLAKAGSIQRLSSVYKRYHSKNRVDLNASIEAVLLFHTEAAVDEMLWRFRQLTKDKKVFLNLLSYDDLVVLSPQLTLPHPSLHADFLIVRCASEAWPDFEHPIMQKTLREIAASTLPPVDAEFFLQGKSLVDF